MTARMHAKRVTRGSVSADSSVDIERAARQSPAVTLRYQAERPKYPGGREWESNPRKTGDSPNRV